MMKVGYSVLRKLLCSNSAILGNIKHQSYCVLRTTKHRLQRSLIQWRTISDDSRYSSVNTSDDEQTVSKSDSNKCVSNAEDEQTVSRSDSEKFVSNAEDDHDNSETKNKQTKKKTSKKQALKKEDLAAKDHTKKQSSEEKKKTSNERESFSNMIYTAEEDSNVIGVLDEYRLKFIEGQTCYIVNCLKTSINKKPIIKDAVYINKMTGSFTCFTCKKQGTWSDLKQNLMDISNAKPPKKNFICFGSNEEVKTLAMLDDSVRPYLLKSLPLKSLDKKQYSEIQKTFGLESILQTTVAAHNIVYHKESHALLIPYCHPLDVKTITDCKSLTTVNDEDEDSHIYKQSYFPGSQRISLFGWREEDEEKTDLILTLTEKDALAIQQSITDKCVLSLPRETQLPQEALPYLERFEKIILWFGNDRKAWDTSIIMARKLGEGRCHVFRPGEVPPAHDALKEKLSLSHLLAKVKMMKNEYLITFKNIREDVRAEIEHHQQLSGVQWKRFVQLNNIMKGLRPGELTVMSGRTGCGKTTFMSEYSLDLCMQGVNTLWGSFEVNNVRLVKSMLTQFALKNLTTHLDEFDHYADEFQQLPMYFMTFFGQENVKKVVDTMAHAVYINDIQHVIVDNLQFMMGEDSSSVDKFCRQNAIYAAFRTFASEHNCHITLVIHPRKENEETLLTTSSVFGSAKATQEADNVMLLQTKKLQNKDKKFIEITKNRFDGEIGKVSLKFNPENLTLSNLTKSGKPVVSKNTKKSEICDVLGDEEVIETTEDETEEFIM